MIEEDRLKKQIDAIFEQSENQAEAFIGVYRMFMPEYDEIEHIGPGWPSCGKSLSEYLWDKFIAFDLEHHRDVVAGGLWMNSGFSTRKKLSPWEFSTETCQVAYKEIRNAA